MALKEYQQTSVTRMTRKEYARQYYEKKYGEICVELEDVIAGISESEELSEEEMINAVENVFWWEWDAEIDLWYTVFIQGKMTMVEYLRSNGENELAGWHETVTWHGPSCPAELNDIFADLDLDDESE